MVVVARFQADGAAVVAGQNECVIRDSNTCLFTYHNPGIDTIDLVLKTQRGRNSPRPPCSRRDDFRQQDFRPVVTRFILNPNHGLILFNHAG
jgi:hypothetical protein